MKLTENVAYVGMHNPGMRVFDIIMKTGYGTTYNSYLITGEKNVLIETVHDTYTKEYIEKIEQYVPISKLDYVILNHTEPDHSGSLAALLKINPELTVIGTAAAVRNLGNITNMTFNSRIVKQGDTLDLGEDKVLEFIIAPNLHWPDSMFTYFKKDKVVFTCDFLGCHYCEQFLFDDQLKKQDKYEIERKNYYDCIFSPFKKFVLDGIAKLENLDIDYVCCSHGPVLRERVKENIELYKKWSAPDKKEKTATIFYVSAYGYTRQLAHEIKDVLSENGLEANAYDLLDIELCDAAALMNTSAAVLFGSPTINNNALEPVLNLIDMTVINSAKGKPALVFGSYGWSGEACQIISDRLKVFKYNVFPENQRVAFKPSEEDIAKIKEAAKEFAATVK